MSNKAIFEIVEEASKIEDRNDRIVYMRNNWSLPLATLLYYTFSDTHKFILPPGAPPYKKSNLPETHNVLKSQVKILYLFLDAPDLSGRAPPNPATYSALKRESKFIDLLETVHEKDSEILLKVKDKLAWSPELDENFIREAYPDLLPSKSVRLEKKDVEVVNVEPEENKTYVPNTEESIREYNKEDFHKEKVYKPINNSTSERGAAIQEKIATKAAAKRTATKKPVATK